MPDQSPEQPQQPPTWPPSESTAEPTRPPKVTAKGVSHMQWEPSEDDGSNELPHPHHRPQSPQPPAAPAASGAHDPHDPWGAPPATPAGQSPPPALETRQPPSQPRGYFDDGPAPHHDPMAGQGHVVGQHDAWSAQPEGPSGAHQPYGNATQEAFDQLSGPAHPPSSQPLDSTQEWHPGPPSGEHPRLPHQSGPHDHGHEAHASGQRAGAAFADQLREQPSEPQSAPAQEAPSVPAQSTPADHGEAPATIQVEPEKKPAHPPTHGRRVRYTIYGVGGLITVALIIAIVWMLGAPPPGSSSSGEEPETAPETDTTALVDSEGQINWDLYESLSASAGSAEWMEWRHGEPPAGTAAEDEQAQVFEPETSTVDANGLERLYQYGEAADVTNWRNVQGQLAFVTDNDALSGIDHITSVEVASDLVGFTPRPGGRWSDEGSPELELEQGSTADCLAEVERDLGKPVDMARATGMEMNAHAVTVFSTGILATTGISGAQGGTCLALPEGYVPTAVALTSNNEFSLVTAWNATERHAILAVIAMGDQAGSYQSSWPEPYPGLPNPGHFGSAQLLGVVELPVSAPTSLSAYSNASASVWTNRAGQVGGPTAEQVDTIASAGYALVGSLEEKRTVVVDLAPLLAYVSDSYFSGTGDIDPFEADQAPQIASELEFSGLVTDVNAREGEAAVSTRDGTVHLVDTTDLRSLATLGSVEVGANPTCLEWGAHSEALLVTSRADATIQWVGDGEITRQLRDERLHDPICASENARTDVLDYAGSAPSVLVADFEGQALHSYRFATARFASGAEIQLEGDFEYGGAYSPDGKPFAVSVALDLDD
ncbi:hypothetical protein [Natronoglycomyces albus]|uniref:Uncharacterized protein n=1 Tax=Natronoglycomyces albus TaxID=2811108 RepID=A0A895XHH6_9ACTN|nr:hypothetical protein [Natronoglycomyces albus]QSB04387.1 hypothetical protein JQS30_11350 [Natronoglycomyces albus]